MRHKTSAIPYFFFSQALADGFRITFSILAPVLFFRYIGQFETGLAVSLGAICVNITDIPGPLLHKRNGLLAASILVFIASLLSGLFYFHPLFTASIVGSCTFLFTMFAVYGVRAATVGSAALLVMILSLSQKEGTQEDVLIRSCLIFLGAIWYSAISLLLSTMRPYRMAQRALGECIRETAKFLSLKSSFYDVDTRLELNYRALLSQQVIVNEKQDALRELLFKTSQIVNDANGPGRALMLTFVETIDLYEHIIASYYNYKSIREKYASTGILENISQLIRDMSYELNDIGFAIQSNIVYKKKFLLNERITELRNTISSSDKVKPTDLGVLVKLTDNLENMYTQIRQLGAYFNTAGKEERNIEHKPFTNYQDFSIEVLKDNLTFNSSAFRHSLRVSIACMAGFAVAHLLNYGHHSYWILITVVFIMKPAFSLTKTRNIQRLIGTTAGGVIGLVILYFFNDPRIDFIFLLILMTGTYTFMRINYIAMVIFTTPYVLILFKLLGSGYMDVIRERLIDTGIGCAVALAAGYLLFPNWEAEELDDHLRNVLKANLNYLRNFATAVSGEDIDPVTYKLARKDVFVSSANLSAAFQRMLSEPRRKRTNSDRVYEFVVLNHILSSNIAGLAADKAIETDYKYTPAERILIESIQDILRACMNDGLKMEDPDKIPPVISEGHSLKDQLEFILYLCKDIYKAKKLIQEKG